jgi:Fic family protein
MSDEIASRVLMAISKLGEKASIEELFMQLPDIPKRTLQRYLAELVEEGKLEAQGKGRARRYLLLAGPKDWRSVAGMEVIRLIQQPLMARKPVGYQRRFLESYRPNIDYFLPVSARKQLHILGNSLEGEAPAGTYARQILGRFLIDLSWASSRLEGNTYSRLDTQNLIEFGRLATGKDKQEAQMILNHKAAIELLVENAEQIRFNRYTFLNLHSTLSAYLLGDSSAEGRLRRIPVQISGTVYQPTGVPQLIEECFDRFLELAEAIEDPFEQAFFVMVQLPYLQPFEDVNKRVSRLGANIPLIRRNLVPLSFVDVPEQSYVEAILGVYELQRVELLRDLFIWAYARSCERYRVIRDSLPAPDPLRFRYRFVLAEIVRETVRQGLSASDEVVRAQALPLVPEEDLEAVISLALVELHQLYEGNILRVGLKLSEFLRWKAISCKK